MPLINSPLPRAPQPRYSQGSGLRSVRDSERPDRAWIKNKRTAASMSSVLRELAKIKQDFGRLRRRILGGGGASAGGFDFGEYDPAKQYTASAMVIFTPDGGAAGTYVALQNVSGINPDTGAPNWAALPNSPPGVWG